MIAMLSLLLISSQYPIDVKLFLLLLSGAVLRLSKPVELTSVQLDAVCLEPGTSCKVVWERCEKYNVQLIFCR
jgi:hypothetical protein